MRHHLLQSTHPMHPRSVPRVHTGYLLTRGLATVMSKESKVVHGSHHLLDVAEGSRVLTARGASLVQA